MNKLVGFTYNKGDKTSNYIYRRNLQGDIIGIYDSLGNEVGGYAYDAYGRKCYVKYKDNSSEEEKAIGWLNASGALALDITGTATLTITGAQVLTGIGALTLAGSMMLMSKHRPGMTNRPPFSWITQEEGINAMNMFGGDANKVADYIMNNHFDNLQYGAGSDRNVIKKWLDRVIRKLLGKR